MKHSSAHAIFALSLTPVVSPSCSLITDAQDAPMRCGTATRREDPCPSPLTCRAGYCVDCFDPLPEICGNRIDDDCDGEIDEIIDADGDGSPWCGDAPSPLDVTADCDDSEPSIHPRAIEICDGRDNDCDGLIDEEPPAAPCPAAAECVDETCRAQSCAVAGAPGLCGPTERCDRLAGACVPAQL